MSEPNFLSKASYFPSNRLKEDESILVVLPDLGIDLIIHRLQLDSISYSWYYQKRVLINISAPWLVEKFVTYNIFVVLEVLGYFAPKIDEFVSQAILVIVQIANGRADSLSKVILWPRMLSTRLCRGIFVFINLIGVIQRPREIHVLDIPVIFLSSPVRHSFAAELSTPNVLMHVKERVNSSFA